jgi:hypothetical protein
MTDNEQLKNDLFLFCCYDTDEPNYQKYNDALLHQIDRMSHNMVLSALNTLRKANND